MNDVPRDSQELLGTDGVWRLEAILFELIGDVLGHECSSERKQEGTLVLTRRLKTLTTMLAGVAALIAPIILESASLRLECI
jgi:hypothetical protein